MSEKKNGPERAKHMLEVLRQWQGLERQAMNDTSEIIEQTSNPLIQMVMSIIRHDSMMHHQIQQFLVDSLTKQDVAVTREEIADIWDKLEAHDKVEKKTIELATTLRDEAWNPVHKHLLDYLITDEQKHESLLAQLDELKTGMSRSSGA
ncbi:MAG: ferritin-like domain-containing protein [Proteobacteria bacterium]|nr:ferritin-like domain-containing protein [Pseudomonadota bacterium]